MRRKRGEALGEVRGFLYGNPATAKEIGDYMGYDVVKVHNLLKGYVKRGHVKKISSGAGFENNTIFYLPEDESVAERRFQHFRNEYWQKTFDRENEVLRAIGEGVLVGANDLYKINKKYKRVVRNASVSALYLKQKPSSWRGPNEYVFYYIEGREQAVAERIASWLPKYDEVTSGEKAGIGSLLNEFPSDIGERVRKLIGSDVKERMKRYRRKSIQKNYILTYRGNIRSKKDYAPPILYLFGEGLLSNNEIIEILAGENASREKRISISRRLIGLKKRGLIAEV